jgi:hypothetical protein
MANRRHNARRLKSLRTYNVREAAKATGATLETVRRWRAAGLEPVHGVYPTIYRGVDVIAFLKQRETKRQAPCGPGRMYCFRCKVPKTPAFGEAEFWPDGTRLGTLVGLCPDCAATMNRRTSIAKLKAATGGLSITIKPADSHLVETAHPSSNPHPEREE